MKKVTVIGAGINGLVAANYLQRSGCEVTLLERNERVGGACTFKDIEFKGKTYPVPTGASVFGMMQDFVFKETGLAEKIEVYRPSHPTLAYFGDDAKPLLLDSSTKEFADEVKARWNENGNIIRYNIELEKVRQFLISGFREAKVPSLEEAEASLGKTLTQRWISGSAEDLYKEFFTSDVLKILKSMPVTESGPVSLQAPFSALSIPLMASGNVFGGNWGYVRGGIWEITSKLSEINQKLGVQTLTSCQVKRIDTASLTVEYKDAQQATAFVKSDAIFIATDPFTAAKICDDMKIVEGKKTLGSSGKVLLVFKAPVKWKGDTKKADFDSAFRFIYAHSDFKRFQESNSQIQKRRDHYLPSCIQVYCEGAAFRRMGREMDYDYLSAFCKDMGFTERGKDLPQIKEEITQNILSRIENPDAFVGSVLYTPKDLKEMFYFPEGNIDHIELCENQTYLQRTFSSQPNRSFYQFGDYKNLFYCGAGSYPCGSVAGTPGYLAATQWLRSK